MIRHRERSPWLALSAYLSDNSASLTSAAEYSGGPAFARSMKSILDDARSCSQPNSRLLKAIDKVCAELVSHSERPEGMYGNALSPTVELEFHIRSEIAALVDEFRREVIGFKMSHVGARKAEDKAGR